MSISLRLFLIGYIPDSDVTLAALAEPASCPECPSCFTGKLGCQLNMSMVVLSSTSNCPWP